MLKTQDELQKRFKETTNLGLNWLDVEHEVIGEYLDYDHIKQFLKKDSEVTEESWNVKTLVCNRETVLNDMSKYMEIAIGKALAHCHLSAHNSITKMRGWMWMLGDNEMLSGFLEDEISNYAKYGVPILAAIIKKYGLLPPLDDCFINMAKGLPCQENCQEGCEC